MTVVSVQKDHSALTMTITCEFTASVEQVWQMWADPRRLERWWGPPTHPATVTEHVLVPGGKVSYHMTGPEGEKYPGWWVVLAVDPPRRLTVKDGFADADGNPVDDMPTSTMVVTISDAGAGVSRVAIASTFPTLEAMEQTLAMGAEEGMSLALGQIDGILAAS